MKKTFLISIAVLLFGSLIPFEIIAQNSYEERMQYCKANPVVKTGTTIDGQTISMDWIPQECIVGASLPSFETNTILREKVNAAYFKKKMNIIVFWFETCPPCIAKIPALNKLKDKYGDEKINFLAIGRDKVTDIKAFIAKSPFNFDLVANGEDIKRKIFQSPWGYPLTIITNKKGKIIYAGSGGKSDETIQIIEPMIIKELGIRNSKR